MGKKYLFLTIVLGLAMLDNAIFRIGALYARPPQAEDFTHRPSRFAQEEDSAAVEPESFAGLRQGMVKYQIEKRGITDRRVLEAMLKVERHRFVPEELQHLAYSDGPLPIGKDQTISQPYIVALMTEVLCLKGKERVLEIGTGSGYQAAILAELAKEVYTIEIIPELAKSAERLLSELGYSNIKVKSGDGYLGWPEFAPFDAVIITCAPRQIPPPLIEQLAQDGRMVAPIGGAYQELKLFVKKGNRLTEENITPVRFVPMTRKEKWN